VKREKEKAKARSSSTKPPSKKSDCTTAERQALAAHARAAQASAKRFVDWRSKLTRAPPLSVRMLDKSEVLSIAGVSFSTLWTWMQQDAFPHGYVAGGKTMWRSDEVTAWVEALQLRRIKGDVA